MKKFIFLFIIFIFCSLNLYAVSENSNKNTSLTENSKKIVAKINNTPIYYSEYSEFLDLFKAQPTTTEDKIKMLDHLIDRKLLLQDAKEKGYYNREEIKKNFKKHKFLHKSNATYEETIVLREYFIENVSKKINITDKEIEDFIKQHKGHKGIRKDMVRDMLALEKEKKLFEKLLKKLRKGKKIIIFKENLN